MTGRTVLSGYVVPSGQGLAEHAGEPGIKASAGSTGGSLTVIETTLTREPPRHVHDREDECFYVLDGSLTAVCGEEVLPAGTGSFVFLPRGIPHHLTLDSRAVRVLLIAAPGGIEDYFRQIAEAPDDAARQAVREAHGIHRA